MKLFLILTSLLIFSGFGIHESYADNTNFLFHFDSSDVDANKIDRPAGVAVDTFDRIFVADEKNHRIQVFNYFGDHLFSFGSSGSGDGQFDRPTGIAIDSSDRIIVTDSRNDRIQVFDADGVFLFSFGSSGSGDGQFDRPTGIAIDSSDRIIVTDSRNDRIQVFDADGVFLFSFGSSGSGDGQLNNPLGITTNTLDVIYVADSDNDRIQVFDAGGKFLHTLGDPVILQNNLFREPADIIIDNSDRFLVADQTSRVIHVLDSSGDPLERLSWTGDKYQSTAQPNGIVVDSTDRIIVSDIANDLILVFGDPTTEITPDNDTCLDCDFSSVSVGQKNYQNSAYNFEINYLANWQVGELINSFYEPGIHEESNKVIVFSRSVPGMPYISIHHLENLPNVNYDDQQYLENLKSLSKKQCDDSFELYGSECVDYLVDAEIITLDGTKAYQVTHTWKEDVGQGLDIQRTSVIIDIVKDGQVWTIQSVNRGVDGNYFVPNDDILKSINSFSFADDLESSLNSLGEKYVNTDIGLELQLPQNWKITPLYDPSDLDDDFRALASTKIDNFGLYSDSVLIMSFSNDASPVNDHLESILIFITKKIPDTAFGLYQMSDNMMSQPSINSASDTPHFSNFVCQDSLKIQNVNDMKSLHLEFECDEIPRYDSIFLSAYSFLTDDHEIYIQYTSVNSNNVDVSLFEESIKTLKISDTINPFDISYWQDTSDLKLTVHPISLQNQEYEVKILSDSSISDVAFLEDDELSFNLSDQTGPIGYAEIYVDKNFFDDKVSVLIDGVISHDYVLIDDTIADQKIITMSYLHPVNSITVSSDAQTFSSTKESVTKPILSFVDTSKDPQSYIDRYNNEESYREWFDSNYPDYTIEEAVGYEKVIEKIPSWVKNNAKWWADGSLKDGDFASGIQHLVQKNIIDVSVDVKSKPVLDFVDTSKDPQSYIDRYNNEESYREWFDSNYPDYTIEEGIGFVNNEIPSWVKNNAGWWAEGLLSEDDFLKGIEYLVEKQIIRVN